MKAMTQALRKLLIVLVIACLLWFVLANYSAVFSKKIKGEVLEVERVTQPTAIIGNGAMTPEQMFSFAVMIRAFDGTIYSASSEDRQWAVAKKGYCVEARFYPYPPWNLEKADTYFNARLVRAFECQREAPGDWKPQAGAAGSQNQAVNQPVKPPEPMPTVGAQPAPQAPSGTH